MFWDALAPDAKRARTGEWQAMPAVAAPSLYPAAVPAHGMMFQAPGVQFGGAAAAPFWQAPAPAPAPAPDGGSDIARQIMNALGKHSPPAASSGGGGGGDIGSMLMDSLRGLMPAGGQAACQSHSEGQALLNMVQQAAAPAAAAPAAVAAAPAPVAAAPSAFAFAAAAAEPAAAPAAAAEPTIAELLASAAAAPPPRPRPRHLKSSRSLQPPPASAAGVEEDSDSDDGEPHRLPPGFGAIPEDIVEERARQREEQRILQLKATQPCRFGKTCKRRDCPNAHPEGRNIDTEWNPCAFGRRCKRKDCFYDHPEGRIIDDNPEHGMCKFGARCSRPDCLYDHPPDRVLVALPDARICFFCHEPGHVAGDCPRNPTSWNFNQVEAGAIVAVAPP